MSGGLSIEIALLDGQQLEFCVGIRTLTSDLMVMVASHFSLKEHKYFGFAYKDETGELNWLQENRRLIDHEFVRTLRLLPLQFLIKFYPEYLSDFKYPETTELFFLQTKLFIHKGLIEVEENTASKLAALALQIDFGDFVNVTISENLLTNERINFTDSLDHSLRLLQKCKVCAEHKSLTGIQRNNAVQTYMREVELCSGYGFHYYLVRDRSNQLWFLGLNQRGIFQFTHLNKTKPKRIFLWKQLENLYFRDRKFSIEVHNPNKNLLPNRGNSGSIFVWFTESQTACKNIWSMAIAQHQFYLDRRTPRLKEHTVAVFSNERISSRPPLESLSRSCVSLSAHSSSPDLSRSGSHSSLPPNSHQEDSVGSDSVTAARLEMVAALKQRYDALQKKLEEKVEQLRLLCLREGELTGDLPHEYPIKSNECLPVVRKRVGTSFSLDQALINKIINKQEETVSWLELEYELQIKIVSAALKLANETSMKKGLRKQRKNSYHLATLRLRDIEHRLNQARARQAQIFSANTKVKKKPRPISDDENFQDEIEISRMHEMPLNSPCPTTATNVLNELPQTDSSRPISGYIPSVVYTRSEYRSQHFPTLSMCGQSVPREKDDSCGGFYNLNNQRTALKSQSANTSNSTPTLINYLSPVTSTSVTVQRFVPNSAVTPQQLTPLSLNLAYNNYKTSISNSENNSPNFPRLIPKSRLDTPTPRCSPIENGNKTHGNLYSNSEVSTSLQRYGTFERKSSPLHNESRCVEHLVVPPSPNRPTPSPPPLPDPQIYSTLSKEISPFRFLSHSPDAVDGSNRTNDLNNSEQSKASLVHASPYVLSYDEKRNGQETMTCDNDYSNRHSILPLRATLQSQRGISKKTEYTPLKPTNINCPDNFKFEVHSNVDPLISGYNCVGHHDEVKIPQPESPLLSLAELAKLRKPKHEKEDRFSDKFHDISVGSNESNSSLFQHSIDLSNTSFSSNHTIISAGSYQPSREESKPFEMSDFYKYSTKFRRKDSLKKNDISTPTTECTSIEVLVSPDVNYNNKTNKLDCVDQMHGNSKINSASSEDIVNRSATLV